ncbi:hypothetical protein THASP1DRAFT_32726 [Thamnocephalis sphaerospora]|uniref:Uncharacterized protein n=1 Tax=Thamnocephalis sphaerospora TaxID=78915 RepID=A0A4P9XIC6_9FUNG|nr:hypothetical protein THASP1DRAFT_32726 [Thamnocephalis sphaerospora]|eukprot:RKP05434.1 hypothetical protein THASP1DRAFT_32726 [Thamnocephalis sphaerospora]
MGESRRMSAERALGYAISLPAAAAPGPTNLFSLLQAAVPLAFQKRDRIPAQNALLPSQDSVPDLRYSQTSTDSGSDGFLSGFSHQRASIERNTHTPVPFDDVVIPTVYRQIKENEHNEMPFDTEQQAEEHERKLKATQKWYDSQRRRGNGAHGGKPKPSATVAAQESPSHPSRPPKSPARAASRSGLHAEANSGARPLQGDGDPDAGAYPSPPSSAYYPQGSSQELSTPFTQGRGATMSMLLPQREAPMIPGTEMAQMSTAQQHVPPPRPTLPAPALANYPETPTNNYAQKHENALQAKASCCIIL